MRYHFFKQEMENWCVPACLQSILNKHGFRVPLQEEIYKSLETNQEGVIINESNLDSFLQKYELSSQYTHPRLSFPEMDFVLEESFKNKRDVLVAFYHNPKNRHCTLLTNINHEELTLHCLKERTRIISFSDLISLMPLDYQCGFYIVSHASGQEFQSAG